MGKLPSFLFYPGDWLKDPNLRRCSIAARGAWMDILCLMFESNSRGILRCSADKTSWTKEDIIHSVNGCTEKILDELISKGVLRISKRTGTFYSKRLINDERKRRWNVIRVKRFRNADVMRMKRGCNADVITRARAEDENENENENEEYKNKDKEEKTKPLKKVKPKDIARSLDGQHAIEVIDLWNGSMGSRIGATPGNIKAIKACIKADPDFVRKYREAAKEFKNIDDSQWPNGKVCFAWSLRMNQNGQYNPVVDRVIAGVYRKIGQLDPSSRLAKNMAAANRWVQKKMELENEQK